MEGVGAPKASDFAARPVPEWLLKTVICQVPLRSFTQEGTLSAAAERLGHLADAGIGCVYLLPIVESDPRPEQGVLESPPEKEQHEQPVQSVQDKELF